jgi:hypothetical protein
MMKRHERIAGYAAGVVIWLLAIGVLGVNPALYFALTAVAMIVFLLPLLHKAEHIKAVNGP